MMLAVLGSLGWLAVMLAAGQAQAPATTQPQTQDEPAMEGLWPTERMIESMIRRWALEAADTYELDDGQHRQVEATMLERGTRMLRENRREPVMVSVVELVGDRGALLVFSRTAVPWSCYHAASVEIATEAARAVLATGSAYNW